jgi:spermidine synthase
MTLWLVAIGLLSILSQVVLLRELNVAFYGSELIYVLALGVWLLWTAAGALAPWPGGWGAAHRKAGPRAGAIRVLFLAGGPLLVLEVLYVRGIRQVWGGVPGADLAFPVQLAAMALALLPVGVVLGLLFQWVAKRWLEGPRTLARAYAIECVGAVAGGAVATLALRAGMQNLTVALACALLFVLAAVVPLRGGTGVAGGVPRRGDESDAGGVPKRVLAPVVGVVAVLLLAATLARTWIDRGSTAWNHPQLLAVADTPYGRTTVTGSFGQVVIFRNGALTFESEGTTAEEFVHLALLQHSAPRSVLVLGGGAEGLVREVQRHGPERVEYVELDKRGFRLALDHLSEKHLRLSEGTPVEITFADPRAHLEAGDGRYDVVLLGMPEPESAQANRYYTREFFARCAARMNEGGVLAFRVRSAENLLTPPVLSRAASLHAALRESFPEVVVLPGVTATFLASREPLERDPDVLASRLDERGIHGRLVSPAYLEYLYLGDRFEEIRGAIAKSVAPPNEDARPVCHRHTLVIWLSRFYPALAARPLPGFGSESAVRPAAAWWAVPLVGVLFALARVRAGVRRSTLAALAGFLGIVTEGVLLLDYQTRTGVLYQDLGILLTVFMGGLAVGAWALTGRTANANRVPWRAGAALVAGFALLELLIARGLASGVGGALAASATGLFLGGAFVGALFAYASRKGVESQRAVVSPLYGADLAGACVGSLAGSLFLLPVWGLVDTSQAMAVLAALTALLV